MRLIPEVTKEYNFAKILIQHRMISLFHIVNFNFLEKPKKSTKFQYEGNV